jgi:hypothetical protein
MRKNPCSICDKGGMACDDCFHNPQNATPIKLYTPKGAARAMLAGKVLKDKHRVECFWGENKEGEVGFFKRGYEDRLYALYDFSGLWGEL